MKSFLFGIFANCFWNITMVHCVRGQSGFYDLALTERNMQIRFNLKLCVYSLGVDIWLLPFKFHFGLIGWPPQPPRERVLKNNKIQGFWWFISHWETRLAIFGAMVDGKIKLSNFFVKWGFWGLWGHWGCWGHWYIPDIPRPRKSLLSIPESSR